jgi:hypothetical protein
MSRLFNKTIASMSLIAAVLSTSAAVGANPYSLQSIDSAELDRIVRQQSWGGSRDQSQYRNEIQPRTGSAGSGDQVRARTQTREQKQIKTQSRKQTGQQSPGSGSRYTGSRGVGASGVGRGGSGGGRR